MLNCHNLLIYYSCSIVYSIRLFIVSKFKVGEQKVDYVMKALALKGFAPWQFKKRKTKTIIMSHLIISAATCKF